MRFAIDDQRLGEVARATGADIPVCLVSSSCVMSGVGEKLAPLRVPRLPCVLINPGVPVATSDVFAALRLRPGQTADADGSAAWPDASASTEQWIGAIRSRRNDLEPPALRVQPAITQVLANLRAAAGCRLARMSGSGATCFGLFGDDAAAADAARQLKAAHSSWWVVATALN